LDNEKYKRIIDAIYANDNLNNNQEETHKINIDKSPILIQQVHDFYGNNQLVYDNNVNQNQINIVNQGYYGNMGNQG